MTRFAWLLGMILGASLVPGSLAASPIMLDVDADAPAAVTQAGFTSMTATGMIGNINGAFVPTATVGGVTVSAQKTGGTSATQFRDRGITSTLVPTPPYQDVLRDFIGVDGVGAEITITIQNLLAGTYHIATFHNDWNVASPQSFFDIYVSDAFGANQLKVDNAAWSNSAVSYYGESFLVQSNGTNDILIRIIEDAPSDDAPHRVRFNGIIITAVPEPASLTLFSAMALVGAFRGWRRRRRATVA